MSEMRLRTIFVLFDMFYMFIRLVSETPHKLPEFRGIEKSESFIFVWGSHKVTWPDFCQLWARDRFISPFATLISMPNIERSLRFPPAVETPEQSEISLTSLLSETSLSPRHSPLALFWATHQTENPGSQPSLASPSNIAFSKYATQRYRINLRFLMNQKHPRLRMPRRTFLRNGIRWWSSNNWNGPQRPPNIGSRS